MQVAIEKVRQFVMANRKMISLLGAVILLALPFIITNSYILHICITVCIFIILALSLNLVTGFAGQLVLGHAAFYGMRAVLQYARSRSSPSYD